MSQKIKILFIINPISGIGRQKDFANAIGTALSPERFDYSIQYTQRAGHATELAREAAGKFDVVTAVGGDGSINEVARSLEGTGTALAIIPCGSGNGLARALGIPMDPKKALMRLNGAQFSKIDTCRVNGRFFLSIAGAGYDSEVARRYDFFPGRGLKTYLKAVLSSFWKYQPADYLICLDGKPIKRNALLVTVCNSSQYGYGFRIAPNASLSDGLLDVVIVKKPPLWRVPFVLINIALGRAHKCKCFEIVQAANVELSGNRKRWVNLDGETVRLDDTLTFAVERQNMSVFC